ncbi:Ig-like domain-containing protein [Neobacillus sp. SAB-20_R2A]|uniref:Ig-like domain-containing protein n=1 Tax=Neobacillus sp. SAB-20_R2A TaxID=3120519 RepID=UPI003C6DE19B
MKRKKGSFSKAKILLFLVVLLSFFYGQNAFAEVDGTGGGKSEPLMLVSSSIANGATGVPLKPEIKLTFSKNIVNMTVRDNNLKCFSLLAANGTNVPIDVILADDQVDFEKRNDAVLIPKSNLAQGSSYSVVISPNLTSKSGVTTGQVIKITFTTEGAPPVTNNTTTPTPSTNTALTVSKTETTTQTQTAVPSTSPTSKTTTSPANTTSNLDEKSTSDQNQNTTTESQTQPEEKAGVSEEKEVKKEKPTPYKAVKSAAETKESPTTQGASNSSFIGWLLVLLAVIAFGFSYLYFKKKKASR